MKRKSLQQIEKTTQTLDRSKTKQVKGGLGIIGTGDIVLN